MIECFARWLNWQIALPDVSMGLVFDGVKKSTDGAAHYDFGHISRIFMCGGVEIIDKQMAFEVSNIVLNILFHRDFSPSLFLKCR